MADDYQPAEARSAVARGEAVILDVREPQEWQQGHIPEAIHIPLQEVPARLSEVPRGTRIICQCATGGRSASAARFLGQAGFDAHNMVGGIMQWHRLGLPVVR